MGGIGDRFRGVVCEAAALARAAGSYLVGVEDPHDEDLVEIIRCGDDSADAPCYLTPVFLVHGYAHNWSAWLPLIGKLERAGFVRFVRFNYESVGDAPEEMAGALARRVHEVLLRTGTGRVHFVGHSLGGVVARVFTGMQGGDEQLGHAVSLATPHRGTPLGRFPLLPRALREIAPEAELVALLENLDDDRSQWTSVAGELDVLVPPSWAHLDGAQQVTLPGLGHLGLLYAELAWDVVCDALLSAEKPHA